MKIVLPSFTLLPDHNTLSRIKGFYGAMSSDVPNEYIECFYRGQGVVVSVYKPNKKGEAKVVFQGVNAISEARIWDPSAKNQSKQPLPPPKIIRHNLIVTYPQIGSDEVGTGDFFGPICVCAAYLTKEDLKDIERLGITDSKVMGDDYIRSIGPEIIHRFAYSQLSLPNEKYNEVHDEFNMNAIKAKMHNRCILNLMSKHPEAAIYQDQFAGERLYYSYLKDETEVARGIVFSTKGESLFPSVALGSVIARYSFLRKMDELSEKYGLKIPYGASDAVTAFASEFALKFGKEELIKVAKINFANYKKIV